jgi:hypothetical protein
MTDASTKYAEICAIPNKEAPTVMTSVVVHLLVLKTNQDVFRQLPKLCVQSQIVVVILSSCNLGQLSAPSQQHLIQHR